MPGRRLWLVRTRDARDGSTLEEYIEEVAGKLRLGPPDLGPCSVPACRKRARRGWRIEGGGERARENKVYVCPAHLDELVALQLAVDGCAPDELVWIAGAREVAAWRSASRGTSYA
jgi:hypothetical protein